MDIKARFKAAFFFHGQIYNIALALQDIFQNFPNLLDLI